MLKWFGMILLCVRGKVFFNLDLDLIKIKFNRNLDFYFVKYRDNI